MLSLKKSKTKLITSAYYVRTKTKEQEKKGRCHHHNQNTENVT